MLRVQLERQHETPIPAGEYFRFYGLRLEHVGLAKPGAIVMHPGPINRGREISSEVADSQSSVILNQVENGVAVRMAVLERISAMSKLLITERPRDRSGEQVRRVADVLLSDGVVAAVGQKSRTAGAEMFDATGMIVAPGLYRHARASARARLRARRDDRDRVRAPPRPAASPRSAACRTQSRSTTAPPSPATSSSALGSSPS